MEELLTGVAIGVGAALFGKKFVRGVVKSTIKAGMVVTDTVSSFVCESGESLSDIIAEAREELKSCKSQTSAK